MFDAILHTLAAAVASFVTVRSVESPVRVARAVNPGRLLRGWDSI